MVAGERSGLVDDEDEDEAHPHLSQPSARASEQRQACDMDGNFISVFSVLVRKLLLPPSVSATQCGSPAGDGSVASLEEETRREANLGRAVQTGLVRLGGLARGSAVPLAWMGQQDDRGPLGGMATACLPTLALNADTATMAG